MSAFTDAEQVYLRDVHPMARLATVGADGTPHVMPIGVYTLDEQSDTIDTMGSDLGMTKKWRDVRRNGRAAIVIDDVLPPFSPRGIEVRGRAEAIDGPQPVIRIHPERIVAWGLDETGTMRNARDVGDRSKGAPLTSLAMYGELAPWFHLLTPPEEYAGEASAILELLREHVDGALETLLELGSGGGNMATHLRRDLRLTLTDLSPEMIELSQSINPDIEHLVGDMRTLRLGRTFDAVLIHDAICYMTSETDLRAALATAFEHLRSGGVAVFEPDHVRDGFEEGTDHGGEDGPERPDGRPGRGLRYLEWVSDPDPTDTTYQVDYALMLRHDDGSLEMRQDRHTEGLFSKATWLQLMATAGFDAMEREDAWGRTVFVGVRRATDPPAR